MKKSARLLLGALVIGYLLSGASIALDSGKATFQAEKAKVEEALDQAEAK